MQRHANAGVNQSTTRQPLRRQYSNAFKLKVVKETMKPGVSVAAIARSYDINGNVVFRWRQEHREGRLNGEPHSDPDRQPDDPFIAVGVVDGDGTLRLLPPPADKPSASADPNVKATRPGTAPCRIEIILRSGIRVRVDADIEAHTLRCVLATVKELS
jgi:transposase-like protein